MFVAGGMFGGVLLSPGFDSPCWWVLMSVLFVFGSFFE